MRLLRWLLLLLLSRNVFRCIRVRPPDVRIPCRYRTCRLGWGGLVLLSNVIRVLRSKLAECGDFDAEEDFRRRPWQLAIEGPEP